MEDHANTFCIHCGARLVVGAKFCPNCGNPVDSQPSAEPQQYQQQKKQVLQRNNPQVVYQTVAAPEKKKKGIGCGTILGIAVLLLLVFYVLVPAYKQYKEKSQVENLSSNKSDYQSDISYEDLARNPNQYKDKLVKFTGQIVQVVSESSMIEIRLSTKLNEYVGFAGDVIYCSIPKSAVGNGRLLDEDIITIYGKASGIKEYTSILGSTVQIPYVVVKMIDVEGK